MRGELRVDALGGAPGGWLQVKITGKLFEADGGEGGRNTNDLDGQVERLVWLRPNSITTTNFRVINTAESNSGDYVDFNVVTRN